MYGCESWTMKKAVLKNWHFQTVVLEKTLQCPLGSKETKPVNPKGNQSLNIHCKDWCWSWSSNTLAPWCEEPTLWRRADSLEKTLMLRKIEDIGEGDKRGWDGWMASLTQWTWVWANSWKFVKDREVWYAAVQGVAKNWTRLSDWTATTMVVLLLTFWRIFILFSMVVKSICTPTDSAQEFPFF